MECNHKFMTFGWDKNGNYQICDKCKQKIYMKTNADKIRAMSNEELAREFLFFCPTDSVFEDGKPHYTGLDGGYYLTSDEAVEGSLKWLDKPVEDTP